MTVNSSKTTAEFISDKANENAWVQSGDIIDENMYLFIVFINLGIICQAVSLFGTAGNVINIIIFIKQGFSDCMNISLLALAISDLCSLLTLIWSNLCVAPAFRDSDIPLVTSEIYLITGIWPHLMFTRITAWITAFISLERCICVILPLKVNNIFTPRRHVIAMVTFFLVTLGCGSSLAFATIGVGWKFYPKRNRTLIGLIYHMDAYKSFITNFVSFIINGAFMPITSMLSVAIFTSILVVKLKQITAWRHSNSSALIHSKKVRNIDKNITTKEQKAAKMVVLISAIFITCLLPANAIFIGGCVEPKLTYNGQYKNLVNSFMSVTFTAEAFNSSLNIFIYVSMSSKYKATFLNMFSCNRCKQ